MYTFGQNTGNTFGGGSPTPNLDLYSTSTTYEPVAPQKGKFSDWSGDMFSTIGGLGTAYFNSKGGYATAPQGWDTGMSMYYGNKRNNTMLYVLGAIVLLVIIYMMSKNK